MSWWAWGIVAVATLNLLGLLLIVGWEAWHLAFAGRAAKRADRKWAAEHGIDLAHTAYPRFLPGDRLP